MDVDHRPDRSPRFRARAHRRRGRHHARAVGSHRRPARAQGPRSERRDAPLPPESTVAAGRFPDAVRLDRHRRRPADHGRQRRQRRQSRPGHRRRTGRLPRRAEHALPQPAADMERGAEHDLQHRHEPGRCVGGTGQDSAESDRGAAAPDRSRSDERRQQRRDPGAEYGRERAGRTGGARSRAAAARRREQQVQRRHVDQLPGGAVPARSVDGPEQRAAGRARLQKGGRRIRSRAADRRRRQHHRVADEANRGARRDDGAA